MSETTTSSPDKKGHKQKPPKAARYFDGGKDIAEKVSSGRTEKTPKAKTKHAKLGQIDRWKKTGSKPKKRKTDKYRHYEEVSVAGKKQHVFTPTMMTSTTEIKEKTKHWKHEEKERQTGLRVSKDPYPGEAPIPQEKIKKYERGKMELTAARTKFASKTFAQREKKLKLATRQAARSELLLQEDPGFLEADEDEVTTSISQHDIRDAVDIASAQKFFELKLNDFGPYRINYTRNGRFLLLGGAKGHIAAIDWMTKKLLCEVNVMETVNDVKWLHQETMFAVAQKQWTYIYDNQGLELHCLKGLGRVLRLEFLPYHFLLCSGSDAGYLGYLDVSIGKKVTTHNTGHGRLDVMCQNPSNAGICLGQTSGTVTMWSPSAPKPLLKMLCHQAGVRAIAVDKSGHYMATSGIDRKLKIWDLRTYSMLQSYKIGFGAGCLDFSQTDKLALGMGNRVEVYQDCCRQAVSSPFMLHRLTTTVTDLQFCPYEDVLGVGHGQGFSSLIIPGAGEANFDAMEANPYQTKAQRKQAEVKMLLEKVQPDMIALDTGVIGQVDTDTLQENINRKKQLLYVKPEKLEYEPKFKMRGKSKSGKKEKRKQGAVEDHKRGQIKEIVALKKQKEKEKKRGKPQKQKQESLGVLDRFRRKDD